MEDKVDSLAQESELNESCGDSFLSKAINNSRDETDELLDSNDEYEHKRH